MAYETLTKGVLPRVQWGPVITGVLCAIAAQIVLGLFGVAFGFASAPGGRAVGILAAIWGLLTPIVASFIGAFIAVRIAADRDEAGAFLHGALVWCIGLIAGAMFITGSLASGAMTAGTAASGNIGVRTIERRDTTVNRLRAQDAADDAAKGAAAGTGAAGVAALLGLGGALLGAAVGQRVVTGRGMRRRSQRFEGAQVRRDTTAIDQPGVSYGDVRSPMTRPSDMTQPPDDRGLHH